MEYKDEILSVLNNNLGGVSALSLARLIFGQGTPKSKINPTLYSMMKDGLIHYKLISGSKQPIWFIGESKPDWLL
jgi:predicted transcriptional regulator